MIQEIAPSVFDNSFKNVAPHEGDAVFAFDGNGKIVTPSVGGRITFTPSDVSASSDLKYLFAIDDKRYYLASREDLSKGKDYEAYTIRQLRDRTGGADVFAAFTAYHLWKWYSDNMYCGTCASPLSDCDTERAMKCNRCGKVIYPRINPAVIVGVRNKDKLLITRYRTGYSHNALIAGFTEIGESLEETVRREVMEEAGLKVKNIRYYKSQPWGMAQDILAGFYCDVEGDDTIRMDEGELKYAEWVKREDIELQPNSLSLTNEMMLAFKENRTEDDR